MTAGGEPLLLPPGGEWEEGACAGEARVGHAVEVGGQGQKVRVELRHVGHHLLHVGLGQLLHAGLGQHVHEVEAVTAVPGHTNIGR